MFNHLRFLVRPGWVVVVLLLRCTEISSFQWTSDIRDRAVVYACLGDTLTLPWRYALDGGEAVENVKWSFRSSNADHWGIAGTVQGQFLPLLTPFYNRIRQVEGAGLQVTSLTSLDQGSYSVTVTVLRGSSFFTYNLTAYIVMADAPLVHHNEALWAQQERATVYDNKTGQLHVQLSCGQYVITGNPPLSVEWKFPSRETHLVSTHINGKFFLTLPNPVEGGNYTCRLSSRFPPVSCLPHNSSVLASSSVTVDEVKIRLSLLEGEQEMNKIEKQDLREEVDRLEEENQKLREIANNLQRYNREVNSMKVRFDARLGTANNFGPNQIIIFDLVTTNEGKAYNKSTGVFTAPFNGSYFFVVTLTQTSSGNPAAAMLNNQTAIFCRANMHIYSYIGTSCESIVYLSHGEQLWVTIQTSYNLNLPAMYSSFVGYSLNLDIPTET